MPILLAAILYAIGYRTPLWVWLLIYTALVVIVARSF